MRNRLPLFSWLIVNWFALNISLSWRSSSSSSFLHFSLPFCFVFLSIYSIVLCKIVVGSAGGREKKKKFPVRVCLLRCDLLITKKFFFFIFLWTVCRIYWRLLAARGTHTESFFLNSVTYYVRESEGNLSVRKCPSKLYIPGVSRWYKVHGDVVHVQFK